MSPSTTSTYLGPTTFGVIGMTCDHCRRAVTEEVSRLAGVDDVVVDLAAGTVSFVAGRPVSHAELAEAVTEAGYDLGDAR